MEQTHTQKLPKLLFQKTSSYKTSGGYIISGVDKEQKESHLFKGDDGDIYKLFLPTQFIKDERRKHPNIGTISAKGGDTCFEVGDVVVVEHNTFREGLSPFDVFFTDDKGEDHFRVINMQVLFAIKQGGMVPRKGVLICNPVPKTKEMESGLVMSHPQEAKYRRDVAIVHKVWPGCTEYEPGDKILLAKYADYPVQFEYKDYITVDTIGDFEVFAKLPKDFDLSLLEETTY